MDLIDKYHFKFTIIFTFFLNREQEANEGLDAARKRHQEELELVKQEAVEQAKRQAERQAKKKLDEEKRKIEAEAQVRLEG